MSKVPVQERVDYRPLEDYKRNIVRETVHLEPLPIPKNVLIVNTSTPSAFPS